MDRVPALDKAAIDDVILGCAQPEGEQGWNIARMAALRAGLPVEIPGATVNRLCASGLEAIALADQRIRSGAAQVIVAGGAESMSLIPMGGNKPSPNPWLAANYPASLLTMGLTAERVARHYAISRDDQDAFALASHQKALAAQAAGRFAEELVPVTRHDRHARREDRESPTFRKRNSPPTKARAPTPPPKHSPSSSPSFTRRARSPRATPRKPPTAPLPRSSWNPAARASSASSRSRGSFPMPSPAACRRRWASAPSPPSPKRSSIAGLTLNDIDLIELNEAFAAQVLAIIRALDLDPARVNVNGGAIALGHPLGCTGAKLTATLLREMKARSARYGMVTMCVGGGMGAAGIFERLS